MVEGLEVARTLQSRGKSGNDDVPHLTGRENDVTSARTQEACALVENGLVV
jgi:hypothetical protein